LHDTSSNGAGHREFLRFYGASQSEGERKDWTSRSVGLRSVKKIEKQKGSVNAFALFRWNSQIDAANCALKKKSLILLFLVSALLDPNVGPGALDELSPVLREKAVEELRSLGREVNHNNLQVATCRHRCRYRHFCDQRFSMPDALWRQSIPPTTLARQRMIALKN
jgi:hypothetical protein